VVGHDCRGRTYSSTFAVALSLALAINDLGKNWLTTWGGSTLVEFGFPAVVVPSNGLHAVGFDSSGKSVQITPWSAPNLRSQPLLRNVV
jgi:hypothetical protein